jgi:hypothetical protein
LGLGIEPGSGLEQPGGLWPKSARGDRDWAPQPIRHRRCAVYRGPFAGRRSVRETSGVPGHAGWSRLLAIYRARIAWPLSGPKAVDQGRPVCTQPGFDRATPPGAANFADGAGSQGPRRFLVRHHGAKQLVSRAAWCHWRRGSATDWYQMHLMEQRYGRASATAIGDWWGGNEPRQ